MTELAAHLHGDHRDGLRRRTILTKDSNAIAAAHTAAVIVAIPATVKAPRPAVAAALRGRSQIEMLATQRPFSDLTRATKREAGIGGESPSVTMGVHSSATVGGVPRHMRSTNIFDLLQ